MEKLNYGTHIQHNPVTSVWFDCGLNAMSGERVTEAGDGKHSDGLLLTCSAQIVVIPVTR